MQAFLAKRALWAATLAFAANFSVWTLYAVLGVNIRSELMLSATEFGLLLAAPIFSGAILRWPVGYLVENNNCKSLFIWQMLLIIPALLLLPKASSYLEYLLIGLWLGLSGVSFTIGIRYVTDWFETKYQGTAMGVFGAGNAGAAITLALVPFIVEHLGWEFVGYCYALGMLLITLAFAFIAPKSNRFITDFQSVKKINPLTSLQVWRFGLYYYFVFGSFLALILWLPQYYMQAYSTSFTTAMNLTLLFTFVSSLVRALGGWFADLYGARAVNWSVFWICLVCLFFLSYPPTTMTIHGMKGDVELNIEVNIYLFTGLILIIGIAQGFGRASVYKIIQNYYPTQMGQVGGFVAFIGATGGCTLPILFGLADDLVGVYSASFMLLYGVLACCMIVMHSAQKSVLKAKRLQHAIDTNFLHD
ncbi:nitrate/nitrite transporter [Pseudoalteromonas sp.]|uniref:MFS transporter n=1 Tax=Pseudoalteromonas sp. TaxID=53249 RepID=UPI003568F6FB